MLYTKRKGTLLWQHVQGITYGFVGKHLIIDNIGSRSEYYLVNAGVHKSMNIERRSIFSTKNLNVT